MSIHFLLYIHNDYNISFQHLDIETFKKHGLKRPKSVDSLTLVHFHSFIIAFAINEKLFSCLIFPLILFLLAHSFNNLK